MSARVLPRETPARRGARLALAVAAGVFGVATILAGGRVLFGTEAARSAAGAYVPFVVWFNFLAGFAYLAAAAALARRSALSLHIASGIAVTTLLVFAAFGVHVASGGSFAGRTVGAMAFRSVTWIGIAAAANRLVPRR